jgi:hypothetical protein
MWRIVDGSARGCCARGRCARGRCARGWRIVDRVGRLIVDRVGRLGCWRITRAFGATARALFTGALAFVGCALLRCP